MNSAQAILSTAGDGHITGEIVGLEGDHISEIIRRSGCFYEADLLDLWASIPFDPSHMMVDVGANIGNHTVFLGLACPNPILAIEPHPVRFESIRTVGVINPVAPGHDVFGFVGHFGTA